MNLRINQGFAQIGIETSRARIEMQRTDPKLELRQHHAQVSITTEDAKLQIDQSAAFASAGLKGYKEITSEGAERGYNSAMEFIAKTAQDGRTLAAIENGGNAIAQLAKRDSSTEKEFGIKALPGVGPDITVIEGSVNIEPGETGQGIHNGVEGEFTAGDVNYNFAPGKVNIYLLQKNFINFSFEPGKIDLSV